MSDIVRTDPRGPTPEPSSRTLVIGYVLPTLALLAALLWPLAAGQRTLYLRDVLSVHTEMKVFQAEAQRQGSLPWIDPHRGGGQPHLGNPNSVSLYPDNLLLRVAPPLWSVNAHFWIHLLLAPWAGFLLGRAWGLRREAAWAVGVVFVGSGYLLSLTNLYNMIAPVVLTPVLVACAMRLRSWRWAWPGLAAVWALEILGGDPMTAVLALALAVSAAATLHGRRGVGWVRGAFAVAVGTLLAAPQWVEFLRILPESFRGHWRYSETASTVASFHPMSLLEVFLPLPFGRPDFSYWGQPYHSGDLPLFFGLYPGVLALALAVVAGVRGRAARWAWAICAVGLFLAMGRHNPAASALFRLPGADMLRLPMKFWLAVAVGSALLAGVGLQRILEGEGRRARRALLGLGLAYASAWALLAAAEGPGARLVARLVPENRGAALAAAERLRWAGSALLILLALAVIGLLLAWARRRPRWAVPALLAFHLGAQLFILRGLVATDEVAPYLEPPALLEHVPPGTRVAHGDQNDLFGTFQVPFAAYPDLRILWLMRTTAKSLQPWTGSRWGLDFELNLSPEGLDSFMTWGVVQAVQALPDEARVRMLEAAGVETLLLSRQLEEEALVAVEEAARMPMDDRFLYVYRLPGAAPRLAVPGRMRGVESLQDAVRAILDRDFDPTRDVVLAGSPQPLDGPPGEARLVSSHAHGLEVDVRSPAGGVLVIQRTYLPIYRAEVDGEPATVAVANLHRLGVPVPAGEHRVAVWVDRRPFALGVGLAALGLTLLLAGSRLLTSGASHGRDDLPQGPRRESR